MDELIEKIIGAKRSAEDEHPEGAHPHEHRAAALLAAQIRAVLEHLGLIEPEPQPEPEPEPEPEPVPEPQPQPEPAPAPKPAPAEEAKQ